MLITPVTSGGKPDTNVAGVSVGPNHSADKIARAKAAFNGTSLSESETPVDPVIAAQEKNLRRIKMNTQQSTNRIEMPEPEIEVPQNIETPKSVINEGDDAASKPLSPQLAALAKQKRLLQLKEQEILAKEKALGTTQASLDLLARLKSDPLAVLKEQEILSPEFYNKMTEHLIADPQNEEIRALRAELESVKEGFNKQFNERDLLARQQALNEIKREAESYLKSDDFALVREDRKLPDVMRLIEKTFDSTGEVLDVQEALGLVQDELLEDTLRKAKLPIVQAKLGIAQAPASNAAKEQPQMRTLTNRDNAAPPALDRRTRAIRAALGQLK